MFHLHRLVIADFLHGLDGLRVAPRELAQPGRQNASQHRVVGLGQLIRFLITLFVQMGFEAFDQRRGEHAVAPHREQAHHGDGDERERQRQEHDHVAQPQGFIVEAEQARLRTGCGRSGGCGGTRVDRGCHVGGRRRGGWRGGLAGRLGGVEVRLGQRSRTGRTQQGKQGQQNGQGKHPRARAKRGQHSSLRNNYDSEGGSVSRVKCRIL